MHINLLFWFIMCEMLRLRCVSLNSFNNHNPALPFKEIIDIMLGDVCDSILCFIYVGSNPIWFEKVMMMSLQSQYFRTAPRGNKLEDPSIQTDGFIFNLGQLLWNNLVIHNYLAGEDDIFLRCWFLCSSPPSLSVMATCPACLMIACKVSNIFRYPLVKAMNSYLMKPKCQGESFQLYFWQK